MWLEQVLSYKQQRERRDMMQNMEKLRVGLVGAGGVGKTSLMKLFEARGYAAFPSPTREFYEIAGIKDETEYLGLLTVDKIAFQSGIRGHFKTKFETFCKRHGGQHIVSDRSLFDHLAYGIYGLDDWHTPRSIQSLIDNTVEYVNKFYTHLVVLPYPQPWMKPGHGNDGFRELSVARNYAIGCMQHSTIVMEKTFHRLQVSLIILDRSDKSPPEVFGMIQKLLGDESLNQVVGRG
jgi:predicted ATPase